MTKASHRLNTGTTADAAIEWSAILVRHTLFFVHLDILGRNEHFVRGTIEFWLVVHIRQLSGPVLVLVHISLLRVLLSFLLRRVKSLSLLLLLVYLAAAKRHTAPLARCGLLVLGGQHLNY